MAFRPLARPLALGGAALLLFLFLACFFLPLPEGGFLPWASPAEGDSPVQEVPDPTSVDLTGQELRSPDFYNDFLGSGGPSPRSGRGPQADPLAGRETRPAGEFSDLATALSRYTSGRIITRGHLAVLPLLAPARGEKERSGHAAHLTLKEALEEKLLVVEELPRGGSVPRLSFTSKADRPIFVPFGAIVTGGKQDRMIRENLVLAAGARREVPVFCIEQGRWHDGPGGSHFGRAVHFGGNDLKAMLCAQVGQDAVWASVREKNSTLANPSRSSNFQGNFVTPKYQKTVKEMAPLKKKLAGLEQACGLVILLGGEVTGLELFATPELFRRHLDQLFTGYLVDAAAGDRKEAPPAELERAARAWFRAWRGARAAREEKEGEVRIHIFDRRVAGGALLTEPAGRLLHFHLFPRPEPEGGAPEEKQ